MGTLKEDCEKESMDLSFMLDVNVEDCTGKS